MLPRELSQCATWEGHAGVVMHRPELRGGADIPAKEECVRSFLFSKTGFLCVVLAVLELTL